MNRQSFFKRNFVPGSLFGRSLLILITPVLLIQMITTVVFFDRHWGRVTSRLAYAVAGEIAVVSDAIEANYAAVNIDFVSDLAAKNLELKVDYKAQQNLPEEKGVTHFGLWERVVAQKLNRELAAVLNRDFLIDTDFQQKQVQVFVQLENGVLSVSFPERRLFSSSSYIFLLWMFSVSFILLVIAILFMRNQIRPIRKLAIAAERFGKGRDTPDFKPEGAREVRRAAEAFIQMSGRIKRQIEQRTTMLAGVSHDLRTPLTRLKLQLAMMGDGDDVQEMRRDISDMEKMIEGYLDFVRGDGEEEFEDTDLNAVIERAADVARKQGKTIHVDAQQITLSVRPLSFERCINNLVGNAARHAQTIWVCVYKEGKKIFVRVEDDGPGLPEAQYDEVFKPFARMDESRSADTGGVGLGLPIAMDIVHSHGGKIWLEKSEHGGLAAVISLPI